MLENVLFMIVGADFIFQMRTALVCSIMNGYWPTERLLAAHPNAFI